MVVGGAFGGNAWGGDGGVAVILALPHRIVLGLAGGFKRHMRGGLG